MTLELDGVFQELGDGTVVLLGSGETVFKLDSFQGNPIIEPQDLGLTWREDGRVRIGAVFNGGAEVFQGRVVLTPRCQQGYRKRTFFDEKLGMERPYMEDYISEIWPLVSEDGLHFRRLQNVVIRGDGTDTEDFIYGIEDVRIIKHEERYLLVGCAKLAPPFKGEAADRIAVYSTADFVNITYHGIVEHFDSRNAVPFPEGADGLCRMLFRFHPHIHLDSLEAGMGQLLNPSKYADSWKGIFDRRRGTLLLEAGRYPHEKEKIGPGPPVIRTDMGWLLIYHAVGEIGDALCEAYGVRRRMTRGYSVSAALLDLDDPRRVICRTRHPIYIPSAPYELCGNRRYPVDTPAVVFPVGALVLKEKLILYAGAGDKYVILLSCKLHDLLNYLWEYCREGA